MNLIDMMKTIFGAEIGNYPAFLVWVTCMIATFIIYNVLSIISAVFKRIGGM